MEEGGGFAKTPLPPLSHMSDVSVKLQTARGHVFLTQLFIINCVVYCDIMNNCVRNT